MAISMNDVKEKVIEVIAKCDSSLDITDQEYEEYITTLDATKIKLKQGDEPTRFVLNTNLKYEHLLKIDTEFSISRDGNVKVSASNRHEEVRLCLIDIVNPSTLPKDQHLLYKKAGDGGAARELMAILITNGIADNLYAALQTVKNRKKDEKALKKG